MEALLKLAFLSILTTLLWCVFAVLPSWLIWNWLVPDIFHLRQITFMETFCLLLLTGFFFKSGSGSKS